VRDDQSNVIGILGISRDIRGLKTAEEKNRDSEAIYQSLIESLPQCIFRKDREGRFEYVNQSLCNLLGLKTEHFLGKTDFDMNPKALAAKYRRDDQWVMTHEKVFEGVEYCKTKTKKIKIRVFKSPVYDARGRVIGVQGVFSAMQPAAPAKSARSKGNQ
jgi:PAS domain S-box-containing protein